VIDQNRKYDLEDFFSCRKGQKLCLRLPKNVANAQYIPQLIRARSSRGANYIEANERIGDKDFKMKIKTCGRESKESAYWLRLVI